MNKAETKKRIEKLRETINHHRWLYHVEDKQEISEAALDSLKKELFDLEQEYPDLVTPDSPTQRVGGEAAKAFKKVKREEAMLSLEDAFSEEDMRAWEGRMKNFLEKSVRGGYYGELKMDGLAVELTYEDGLLELGATRGDGKIGEEVTMNLKTIEAIPLKISEKGKVTVRGEVYLTKKEFKRINKELEKEGKKTYANPRNLAAGSIRQLNPKITASRKLSFCAYGFGGKTELKTHKLEHEKLRKLGFSVEPHDREIGTLEQVIKFRDKWDKEKEGLNYEIDGVVVRVNSNDLFGELGIVGKAPRGAIAYKFAPKEATTIVKEIMVQVGRTGVLTPVAVMEPVQVGGVRITHATLHNEDEIRRLGLRIGDTVIVSRAGDVIPKITKVLTEMRSGREKEWRMPVKCPIGNSRVVKVGGLHKCEDSRAAVAQQIKFFVSRAAFDIRGLGRKQIERFIKEGLIGDAADIFVLKRAEIAKLSGLGERSAENIVSEIERKKAVPLARFILALGILHVGEETANLLAKEAVRRKKNIKEPDEVLKIFQKITMEELQVVPDIGPVVAESIYEWWRDEENIELVKEFQKNGVRIEVEAASKGGGKLEGKTFVLTGSLKSLTRDEAKQKIRNLGGDISGSVSRETDYVVAGDEPGSKYDKAKELGIKIINEEEFLRMVD